MAGISTGNLNLVSNKGECMTHKKLSIVVVLGFMIAASFGCATMNDVVKAKNKGKGTTKDYPVTSEQAWEISKTVFRWEGSDAIEEHKDKGYMLTSSGMNMVSYGTVMGAWIESITKKSSRVTVITKRRLSINIATTLTETTFHKTFAQAVEIVKKGQPLPLEKPKKPRGKSNTPTKGARRK
jgi:hypothetical protein